MQPSKRRAVDKTVRRLAIALLAIVPAACALFEPEPASPLIGSWTTADHDRVTFRADTVVLTPEKGPATTLNRAECNGVFKLAYGTVESTPMINYFPAQPDLAARLKAILVQPIYPGADLACDRGGTTYMLLGDRDLLAIYRDNGVGGMQRLTRL